MNEIVIQTFLISLHFSKGLENANGESTRAPLKIDEFEFPPFSLSLSPRLISITFFPPSSPLLKFIDRFFISL